MPANQITVLLDPAQLPSRQIQDQQVFDNLVAALFTALPTFGAQFNAGVAAFNAAAAGTAFAIPYTVDLSSTSDADPGAGKLRFSSATQNSATVLRLDLQGSNLVDYTRTLDSFDASSSTVKGTIRIMKQGDFQSFLTFNVTARSAPSGYRDITVAVVDYSAANPFVNGDAVLLFFQRTGDKGDTGLYYPTLKVQDQKASGTAGGSATAGTSTATRVLNTTLKNTISGASLASNQITLPAGTYKVRGSAPASGVDNHRAFLYSVTGSATLVLGTNEYSSNISGGGAYEMTRSLLDGEFTLAASTVIEVRHSLKNVTASVSLALGTAVTISGVVEVYTDITIEKIV